MELHPFFCAWRKWLLRVLFLYPLLIFPNAHTSQECVHEQLVYAFKRFKVTNLKTDTHGLSLVNQLGAQLLLLSRQYRKDIESLQKRKKEDEKRQEEIRDVFMSVPDIPALPEKNKEYLQQRPLTQNREEKEINNLMSNLGVLTFSAKNKQYDEDRTSPTGEGDSCSLEFMGTITMSPSLYYLNRELRVSEAKPDDDILVHFHPAGCKRITSIEPIHMKNLDILRIPLFQKEFKHNWVKYPSIPLKTWDKLPLESLDVRTFKEYLSTNPAFTTLREKGHASFFGIENESATVDTGKLPIHGFCLSAIAEDVYIRALEVKKTEHLHLEMSQYAQRKKEMLENNIVIDDMLGVPVDTISILLHRKASTFRPHSPEVTFDEADPTVLQLQFLALEYIYTPPINDEDSAAATTSPAQEVRWDIVADKADSLVQETSQVKERYIHKGRGKRTSVILPTCPVFSDSEPSHRLPQKGSLSALLVRPSTNGSKGT